MRGAAAALVMGLAAGSAPGGDLHTLPGWIAEDHGAALSAWRGGPPDRSALEAGWIAGDPVSAFVTGYFEPELDASPIRTASHAVPLHGPPEAAAVSLDRGAIMAGALDAKAPVIAWLADPVDAYFLHVQGSGRLAMPDGRTVRVGYAGRNAHPYVSIGRLLVERGIFAPGTLTADLLADWLRADPGRGARLMAENPSYIFFERRGTLSPSDGPVGAAGVPLTAMRSIAVDPGHHPLGRAYWLEAEIPGPGGEGTETFRGLVVAEDTGSAIRGPGRVDLFTGSGAAAGLRAGRVQTRGRLWPILRREAGR